MTKRSAILRVLLLLAVTALASGAAATVRNYRYSLSTRSPYPKYAGEVPAGASGQYLEVETDSQGRVVRVASIRNGHKEAESLYHFSANATLCDSYDEYRESEKTGHTQVQRNASGDAIRDDDYTTEGTHTGYSLYSYNGNVVEGASYNADGKMKSASVYTYSPASGLLISDVAYANPDDRSFHTDHDYDENGLVTARRQFRNGALENSGKFTYDAQGEEIRQDVYNASGTWYAAVERKNGLAARRLYEGGRELRYTYDDKRMLKETLLYVKDTLICRFAYDRLSDGTVKRSIATGPDGTLWAEYPDQQIYDVDQQGHPISGKPAVIHKTGNWW